MPRRQRRAQRCALLLPGHTMSGVAYFHAARAVDEPPRATPPRQRYGYATRASRVMKAY